MVKGNERDRGPWNQFILVVAVLHSSFARSSFGLKGPFIATFSPGGMSRCFRLSRHRDSMYLHSSDQMDCCCEEEDCLPGSACCWTNMRCCQHASPSTTNLPVPFPTLNVWHLLKNVYFFFSIHQKSHYAGPGMNVLTPKPPGSHQHSSCEDKNYDMSFVCLLFSSFIRNIVLWWLGR